MRILIVGAGAVGGYFGGRLMEKEADVTFLVREGRKKQLEETGLVIESVNGNATFVPKTIRTGEEAGTFDLIILSTKAYHLGSAIDSIRPYVSDETTILPLLNGIRHYEKLAEEFGAEKVIGGLCFIETTLDQAGRVIQTSASHDIVFGERGGERTDRILKIEDAFSRTNVGFRLSNHVEQDIWNKYMFISTMSGITTLFRSPIGPIREESNGRNLMAALLTEIISVMKSEGAPLSAEADTRFMKQIDGLDFSMKTSMQRDMEKLLPVEADHLHGYLLDIARKNGISVPVLEAVYANLKVYEQNL
ncbi:ketopantoate reductase family protein [Bacillus sp. BRMEA1]|uniref:ketopantoate reductase family protein n=1 Tax=Neobacillus endophyticus TaxID=2738405 RepID=UPI001563A04F|nr:ketopantoate reductase family protein [Neobacillus endophyticus]NRD78017.1 ketopantoate reductase family protein [Neobacillus endophyticus]